MKRFFPIVILLCLMLIAFVISIGCSIITGSTPTREITTTTTLQPTKTSPVTTSSIRVEDIKIIVEPCDNDPEGDISFDNLTVEGGFLDRDYYPLSASPELAKVGSPCFLVSGNITNKSDKQYWVAYFARGYDKSGNIVSRTLDTGPIIGIAVKGFNGKSTESFVLHSIWSENVSVFNIRSQKSTIPPP